VNISVPNLGYIHNQHTNIKILNKEFKEIASCQSPYMIKKIHAICQGKTFLVEFELLNNILGIFKLTQSGKLAMQTYELPHGVTKVVIDENEAQLICFGMDNKVTVINEFTPILDFVAIDKELDIGTSEKLPEPLRGVMTSYLGNPRMMKY
jgi:hypothetical protein